MNLIIYLGFIPRTFRFVILEAKKEDRNPLDGKEQAKKYAHTENVRFVILSNGNLHYFWDLERGDPEIITEFPSQESLKHRQDFKPDNQRLADEEVNDDYIALMQKPNFKDDPRYQKEETLQQYLWEENLQILRPYQLKAIHALQKSAKVGNDRFLFEMATGTGKLLFPPPSSSCFYEQATRKEFCFWLIVWNWKIRHIKTLSAI